jgi:hypothetical protein
VQVVALSARDWGKRNCELRSSLSIGFGRAADVCVIGQTVRQQPFGVESQWKSHTSE